MQDNMKDYARETLEYDDFYEMSKDAQLLFFYLLTVSDGDFVVSNPRTIARMAGIDPKRLTELLDRKICVPASAGIAFYGLSLNYE